jgi:hypothetical protein
MDENKLGKVSNPTPSGYKGDSNHCIKFFSFENNVTKKYLNH